LPSPKVRHPTDMQLPAQWLNAKFRSPIPSPDPEPGCDPEPQPGSDPDVVPQLDPEPPEGIPPVPQPELPINPLGQNTGLQSING
jgi:hypothetical protein